MFALFGYWPPELPSGGGAVDSVFGRVGVVVAADGDYDAGQVDNDSAVPGATVKDALDALLAAIVPAPVDSVFGRVGVVVAVAGDYDASQVDNDSSVAGASVGDALDSLLGSFAALAATVASLDSSDVANASGVAGATVTAALNALAAAIVPAPVTSVFTRTGAVVAVAGDYAASQVNNDSAVSGATVKAALDTLANLEPFYGLYGSRPAAGHAGRAAYLSDSPVAQWVDDGTRWRPLINGMLGVEPPSVAAMTAFNNLGTSFTDQQGTTAVVGVNDGAAPGQLRGMVQANSASTAYARGTCRFDPVGDVTTNHFAQFGVLLRESASSKAYMIGPYQDFNGRASLLQVSVWTSNSVRSVALDKGYAVFDSQEAATFRVRRSGANVVAEMSRDGVNWTTLDSRVMTTVFTTAPDQAGWAAVGINVVPQFHVLSFESGS